MVGGGVVGGVVGRGRTGILRDTFHGDLENVLGRDMAGTILVSNGFELELHAEVPRPPGSRRQPRSAASEVGLLRSNPRCEAVLLRRRWQSVPGTTPRSPWLVDPIREHCRRFWCINGLRRGTIDDVPLG